MARSLPKLQVLRNVQIGEHSPDVSVAPQLVLGEDQRVERGDRGPQRRTLHQRSGEPLVRLGRVARREGLEYSVHRWDDGVRRRSSEPFDQRRGHERHVAGEHHDRPVRSLQRGDDPAQWVLRLGGLVPARHGERRQRGIGLRHHDAVQPRRGERRQGPLDQRPATDDQAGLGAAHTAPGPAGEDHSDGTPRIVHAGSIANESP